MNELVVMEVREINKKAVGARIKQIRMNKGYTLEQFGKDSDINAERSNVSKWERGATLPNKARLEVIAKKGNMTVNELLYGNNKGDIEELEQRLMEIPIEERLKLILRVLNKTVKSTKEKSSC